MGRLSILFVMIMAFSACSSGPSAQVTVVENPSDPLFQLIDQAGLKAQSRGSYYAMDFTMPDGRSQMVYCKVDAVRANTYSYYEFYTYSGNEYSADVLQDLLLQNLERKVSFWGLYPETDGSDVLVLSAAVELDAAPDSIFDLCWMLAIDGDSLESRLQEKDVY